MKKKKQTAKGFTSWLLPAIAALVVAAAIAVVLLPKGAFSGEPVESAGAPSAASEDGSALLLDPAQIGSDAVFCDYETQGVTVEFFAVQASDGSIRLALNTCQICNGSPYAYFEQDGDDFVCQNCGNRFSADQIGLVSGGCNPVPITADHYLLEGDTLQVSTDFLEENAARFTNWKQF